MKTSTFLAFSAAVVVGFSFAACNCQGPVDPTTDGGPDGGPGSTCLDTGATCSATSGKPCCSGVCGNDGTCALPTFCKAPGTSCQSGTECCTNRCTSGSCSNQQCLDIGQACTGASDCCTFTCTGGVCAAIPGTGGPTLPDGGQGQVCRVLGQACSAGSDCCSTNCQGGVCVRAFSCNAYNDVCLSGADCCSSVCSTTDGTAGYCVETTGTTGCIVSGNPCNDGTNCCTRVCLDQGSGAKVCQPVGGCRVAGDYCSADSSCCGGIPTGTVDCVSPTSMRCDNGQACRAPGTICGKPTVRLPDGGYDWHRLPDGGQFQVNNETNCCDGHRLSGSGGMEITCKVDRSGVPRCFGGGSFDGGACPDGFTGEPGCCIPQDGICQFRDQCCNDALCLPDENGTLRCSAGSTCDPVGTPCDPSSANCCAGTSCQPTSELSSACQPYRPPPDGGYPDGGQPDAGTCSANGASCASGATCCSGICSSGVCTVGGICQPQGAGCTAGSDCCFGLICNITGGATTGTCQTSSTGCSTLGQACSTTVPCCSGTQCLSPTGMPCDGTTSCSCDLIIN